MFLTKIAITALVRNFLSYLYIICINHMTLVIMIFIAKYMNNVYFTKYFLKLIFLDLNSRFRVLYHENPKIFC